MDFSCFGEYELHSIELRTFMCIVFSMFPSVCGSINPERPFDGREQDLDSSSPSIALTLLAGLQQTDVGVGSVIRSVTCLLMATLDDLAMSIAIAILVSTAKWGSMAM